MKALNFYQHQNLFRSNIKSFGRHNTFYDFTYRAINYFFFYKVLICIAIGIVDPNYQGDDGNYLFEIHQRKQF